MTTTADAVTAILFHGSRCSDSSVAGLALHDLRVLLADEGLQLEIHAWIDADGPDGEQLYCLADLLSRRFALDAPLAASAAAIVQRDGAALESLQQLGERCSAAGFGGAASWCHEAAAVLRPQPPGRTHVAAVRPQRRMIQQSFSQPCQELASPEPG